MKDIFEEVPFEPLPPLGPTSDPDAVVISDEAINLTGLGEASTDGRLHAIELITELRLAEKVVKYPDRTDKDTDDSSTELES